MKKFFLVFITALLLSASISPLIVNAQSPRWYSFGDGCATKNPFGPSSFIVPFDDPKQEGVDVSNASASYKENVRTFLRIIVFIREFKDGYNMDNTKSTIQDTVISADYNKFDPPGQEPTQTVTFKLVWDYQVARGIFKDGWGGIETITQILIDLGEICRGSGSSRDNFDSDLYLIPDNPGVLDWFKVGGGQKGAGVARGIAFRILDFFLGFIAIIAVAMFMYAGFLYITAGGESEQQEKAGSIIKWSSIGLILVILSETLVRIIFPTRGEIREGDTILDAERAFQTSEEGTDVIITILNWALGFVGALAVAMLIYGGFLYLTAHGESEQQEKATKLIVQAVIGIVIILLAFSIVNIIIAGISNVG